MDSKNKISIVCLSAIRLHQLDVVYEKLQCHPNKLEIWSIDTDPEIMKWAEDKSVQYKPLYSCNHMLFSTPNPKISLRLPENFSEPLDIYFVCNVSISADGYLMGAIFNLCKLIQNKQVSDHDFSDYAFEIYLYFKKNTFFAFIDNSENVITNSAWSIDHFLNSIYHLKTKRVYKKFYDYLSTPINVSFDANKKSEIALTSKRLYTFFYNIYILRKKVQSSFFPFYNSFFILYNMISFKLKRRFKK